MERRELFVILGASAVAGDASAQHLHELAGDTGLTASGYKMRFFSRNEEVIVDRLADIIIPTDDHSPGAHDAMVVRFIDLLLAYSNAATREQWRNGIGAVEAECRKQFGKAFADCTREQHEAILAGMASNEGKRTDELGQFFVMLKRLTVDGYHYSPVGLKDIGYRGAPVRDFPGCTHPEHKES